MTGPGSKPTVADLGIDPATLEWQRSGEADGSIEVAFPLVIHTRAAAADTLAIMRG